jgi:cell shape-determining protein MreD
MRSTDRSVLAALVAVALATITVLPLTQDRSFLVTSWFLLVILGGVSAVLRRLRMGSATVLGVLSLVLLVFSLLLSATLSPGGSVPWYQR